jgi:polyhydroxyalkanoate synthesis regulator protein
MTNYIRYKNRKLYSKNYGYVTLETLIDDVKRGEIVTVTDYETKNDLTREVLARCVAQLNLPVEKMMDVIRGAK